MIYLWYLVSPLWAMLIIVIWDQLELLRSSGVPTKYSTLSLYPIHAVLFQVSDRLSRNHDTVRIWRFFWSHTTLPFHGMLHAKIGLLLYQPQSLLWLKDEEETGTNVSTRAKAIRPEIVRDPNHLASMFKLSSNWSGLSQLINEYNWRHVVAASHNISMQMTQIQLHLSLGFKINRSSKT